MAITNYDFEIIYRKSEQHANADMFSRLPLKAKEGDKVFHVQEISLPVTSDKINEETNKDCELQKILKYLRNDSWPRKPSQEIKPYAAIKDELSLERDNIILWGNRVIIPRSLRKEMLKELHHNHPGIVRMKGLARMHMWYPGINKDIENVVQRCENCQMTSNCPASSVPHPWNQTSKAMERVHIDYIGPYHNNYILLMIDAHSGWIEAQKGITPNTCATIKVIEK